MRTAPQAVVLVFCLAAVANAAAGPLRDRLGRRRTPVIWKMERPQRRCMARRPTAGLRLLRDVAYGSDAQQRMDIYVPDRAAGGACAVLVHGGGWRRGDKAHDRLVQNKLAHWAAQGVVLVSVNYRMLPEARPTHRPATSPWRCPMRSNRQYRWGQGCAALCAHGAFRRCTSGVVAGGVARAPARDRGRQPVLGTVALDSGAMDVEQTMEERHAPCSTRFGRDLAYWRSVSPQHQWQPGAAPMLVVCSSLRRSPARRPGVCGRARRWVRA